MAWADNHCHLPLHSASEVVADARNAGVELLINIGTDVANSRQAIAVAKAHRGVWATAGVHPHEASQGIDGLEDLLTNPEVVAVGEAGLDYYYDHSPRSVQREAFAQQIELAKRYDLALVVHSRAAWDDTFAVFDSEGMPSRTVMHCFTGSPHEAEKCLQRGAMISFSGIITFPKAPEVRDSARACPLDRLMVETDSPFLAPVPHRGKPNRPALVTVVGAAVAEAKGLDVLEVQEATLANTQVFYACGAASGNDDSGGVGT